MIASTTHSIPHSLALRPVPGRLSAMPRATLPASQVWVTLVRVLALMLVLLLALQLIAASQHNHSLATHSPDCASCVFAFELPPEPASGNLDALARAAGFAYHAVAADTPAHFAAPGFLIPHAQGPPSPFCVV
ncbi:MAG: hypothetical protein ACI83P_001179 [Janthinobacterium sp.]|jgi:hypothetical protein